MALAELMSIGSAAFALGSALVGRRARLHADDHKTEVVFLRIAHHWTDRLRPL
jgi:hypothetical protein